MILTQDTSYEDEIFKSVDAKGINFRFVRALRDGIEG